MPECPMLKGGDLMPRATKSVKENTDYISNGVLINPSTPSAGEKVKIVYDGLLSKSGATHVFARIGYGNRWENTQDVPMMKTGTGFETTIPVMKADTLNVAFKDCANHWDNNSGMNYSFDVVQ
jgi:hypothetical protein